MTYDLLIIFDNGMWVKIDGVKKYGELNDDIWYYEKGLQRSFCSKEYVLYFGEPIDMKPIL